jgi:DNA end-binding protein Ku
MPRSSRPRQTASDKTAKPPSSGGPRPIWTGTLRLSLVSVPVILVPATQSSSHLALHQIHGPSGKRIRYDKVAPGVGSVDADDIEKAVEVGRDRYVVLSDSELDSLKIEAKRTLDLVQFVKEGEIDPIWFERPYYLLPDGGDAEEPYGVIRDALRKSGKVGVGQFVMRNRDYVAALKPCGDGMMLETLRFADEVKDASRIFEPIKRFKPDAELLDLAGELIARKTADFNPDAFHDRYAEALKALVEAKAKHERFVEVEDEELPSGGAKVIDLVEALKRSVRAASGDEKAESPKPARARKAKAG